MESKTASVPETDPKPGKKEKSFGSKVKRAGLWGGAIIVFLFLSFTAYAVFGNYSSGYRVGNVIKLSNKGYVLKTWEGQLDQGYLTRESDEGVATRIWYFSVGRGEEDVRSGIDQAIVEGKRVKLYYREKFMHVPFMGDTKYFIYKVEQVR